MELIDNATIQDQGFGYVYSPASFVPADVVTAGIVDFLDGDLCRSWILSKMHQGVPCCPGCGSSITSSMSLQSFWRGDRVKCCRCGKFFTALTGTFLSGGHLSYSGVVMMAILTEAGAHDTDIARLMNMSTEGVRGWRIRLGQARYLQAAGA